LEKQEQDPNTKLDEKYATDLLDWEITELMQAIEADETGRKAHLEAIAKKLKESFLVLLLMKRQYDKAVKMALESGFIGQAS
jgi:hypothetical protein